MTQQSEISPVRPGMEYWDKICGLKHYGFIHSPDNSRVLKAEGIGNWIDKFEAQSIVDEAQSEINALRARPALPELNDDLREILGRICHTCIAISQVLRLMGHDIKRRAEDEQAATIHWLLGHYMRDAGNWRANASWELRSAAEKHKAANAADSGEVGTYPQEGL